MSKQEFYVALSNLGPKGLNDSHIRLLDYALTGSREPEFIHIDGVSDRLAQGRFGYWLYDRTSKTWVINVPAGHHVLLSGVLYNVITGNDLFEDEASERYVIESLGFYVSGACGMYIPIKDDRCSFTDEEKIFENAKGKLPWRGIL